MSPCAEKVRLAFGLLRHQDPLRGEPAPLPDGLAYGDAVAVLPEETGSGVVQGGLLPSPVEEIAVRPHAERAGERAVNLAKSTVVRAR